ncbi:PolC-type DNA polymerase III [Brochothrix thermosphacta]|uniref:PolC-type DNA polymerase III n=1 Tax=Brochothrix thermosphacta TaxID=2756 RepID=UPI00083F7571|nr:PolC-type DNA polymerase III [Brochothrix thermosphacta]ODJ53067.1 PolC-type DNA polymerase III [Brochothrix thermosphacta]
MGNPNETNKLNILIEQIGLSDNEVIVNELQTASLEKVVVHQQIQRWQFVIQIPTYLTGTTYRVLTEALGNSFDHIHSSELKFISLGGELTSELLQEYWPFFANKVREGSPMIGQRIADQVPSVSQRKITLSADNETEKMVMSKKCTNQILPLLEQAGITGYTFIIDVQSVNRESEEFKKFTEDKAQEDKAKALATLNEMQKRVENQSKDNPVPSGPLVLGLPIKANEEMMTLDAIVDEERRVTVQGYIFDAEVRELRSGRSLVQFKITDYRSSIIVKMFSRDKDDSSIFAGIKKGLWVKVRGSVQNDNFSRELILMAQDINEISVKGREDKAAEKRVELHLHTPMSAMDAVTPTGDLVAQAAKWGHKAVAITDHSVAQSFPDAHAAGKKHGIKILYGVEINLIDEGVPIVYNESHRNLRDASYVVFDVETTGLSAVYDKVIELGAVRMVNGEKVDEFEAFINPGHPLSATTINLTGITDDMVANTPTEEEVFKRFKEWAGDDILVAHNASFDMGFLNTAYKRHNMGVAENPVLDTLELARFLYPHFKNHRLNTLTKRFNIILEQHHRAIFDSEATAYLAWKLIKDAEEEHTILFHDQLNEHVGEGDAYKRARPSHATVLATNYVGLKNMFKLISEANLSYFHRIPRVPRTLLNKLREGLIVGSGCDRGEVFMAMMQKGAVEAENAAAYYDYIEVMPPTVYQTLIENEMVRDREALQDIIKNVIALGEKLGKTVVATGNVHYLDPKDKIYRKILINSQGGANPLNRYPMPDVHFRTTDEMLEEFAFLGEDKAFELVVTNTNAIADQCEPIVPVKDELYTPKIEGADEEVTEMSYNNARAKYGEELPQIIIDRLEKELKSIIGHGFGVIYLISQKLVKKSNDDGYIVGSRGSVGSSFVATMTGITEVNPLPPHYVCPKCQHSEFFHDGSVGSGFDLPDKPCTECGTNYDKDGHDIPFETFLGFKGDKVPDIDLNFSGDYQAQAHNYTKVLFGEEYVYRAGTIGTVAEKTAYGFVKAYERDNDLHIRGAETDRLVSGCTGVKRTTGQHPGGIIVIPDYMDVYDFSPIQFPADDVNSDWKTTHFDFHSIHDNVLKLDILGHDDPTMIRMLQDLSGITPEQIPTDDPEVFALFSGTTSLGVTPEDINSKTGTLGVPEFGTRFVRQMLEQTNPSTFSELLQISGLSHGTDVWLGNAEELIKSGQSVLSEVIGCRDDIMVGLIYMGVEESLAFKIMESVRKGKGIPEDWEAAMRAENVPDWYIDSCKKIKYMFPKAHAAAYVLNAVRIAYFKVHHPLFYYATYFTVRADDFDLISMVNGKHAIVASMKNITDKGMEASTKEKNLLTVLELANEMVARGYKFQKVDLYKSKAAEFIIEGDSLIPPFDSIPGLGTNVAKQLEAARADGIFLSKEDVKQRSKVSQSIIDYMTDMGCLEGLPDENQLSLF